jgi:hypothetical protein
MIRTCAMGAAAVAVLALAACGPGKPEGQKTGAYMPDTSRPEEHPPDAAITGVVPLEGKPPVQRYGPDQKPSAPNEPANLPPVDVPEVQPK